jgi:hypothetical protein
MFKRLSKNFVLDEFRCKDNCIDAAWPTTSIVILLELVRMHFGYKYETKCVVIVNDACRCYDRNEEVQEIWYPIHNNGKEYVPGSSRSRHMELDAADFRVSIKHHAPNGLYYWADISPVEVGQFLDNMFPNSLGIGVYDKFIHADTREDKARW